MSLKESIMESFSQFFHKIVNNHPLKEELLQNLTTFQQIILSDSSNYLQTKLYISSLCQKSLTKTSQNHSQMSPTDLPTDLSLKEFTPEKLRSPFSLLTKFTYATFKDYLTKNLISLPIDSPLLYRFSHIREFLPDSQNFYRVIGLSLLEVFLSDISHISRLYEWYNKIFHRDLTLSSHIYSFPAEELRSTFCGYLKQLIQTRVDSEETREGQKSRNLLYNMDCKDAIFDMALISFVKEMLIRKLDNSKLSMENFQGRIKANDSALIEDLIGEISHTFNVNLIVQIVQNKTVSEVVYAVQTNDPRASPTLHILNEKQISYQNFSILNIDNFDNDIFSNQNQSVSHVRNTSLQHSQPSLNPKLEKAFSTDSKNPLEKPSKNIRPSQILSKRASLPEGGINYNRRSVSDKVEPDFLNQFVDKIEFKFDEEDIKLNKEELSPKEGVLSLSKILNGSADTKSKQSQGQEESPMNLTNQNQDAHYEKKDGLSKLNENSNQLETPPKFQNQFFKDNDSLKSPLTLNLTPATQLQEQSMKSKTSIQPPDQTQLFNYDVNILETQKEKVIPFYFQEIIMFRLKFKKLL